jgi:hypothetical protein
LPISYSGGPHPSYGRQLGGSLLFGCPPEMWTLPPKTSPGAGPIYDGTAAESYLLQEPGRLLQLRDVVQVNASTEPITEPLAQRAKLTGVKLPAAHDRKVDIAVLAIVTPGHRTEQHGGFDRPLCPEGGTQVAQHRPMCDQVLDLVRCGNVPTRPHGAAAS